MMQWSYGVTTVPARFDTTLPRALESLAAAGFSAPRLFVDGQDGECDARKPYAASEYKCCVTLRESPVGAFGNWLLALQELIVREPTADRYAIFQDDVLAVRNLRQYLDVCELHPDCYWNLITYPGVAQLLAPEGKRWCVSTQSGKGAQGLVFGREMAVALLSAPGFIARCLNTELDVFGVANGRRNIDGGVLDAMKGLKVRELCHVPSLLWHDVGAPSTIREKRQSAIRGWPGESFDAMDLLNEKAV